MKIARELASLGLTNDGSFILILDHFLDDHSFFKKTDRGLKSKLKVESLPKSTKIDIQKFQQHQPYENIIIIFRDPILRAMSPSNEYAHDLKRGILYTKQKISNEYFEQDFIEDLETIIPAWKAWFEKLLKINAKFCLVNYDKLKTNVIEEVRPVVNFLGFKINEELEKCILTNQEGTNHRPEKSKDEINRILSSIPPDDLKKYSKIKEDVLQMLKSVSSC